MLNLIKNSFFYSHNEQKAAITGLMLAEMSIFKGIQALYYRFFQMCLINRMMKTLTRSASKHLRLLNGNDQG